MQRIILSADTAPTIVLTIAALPRVTGLAHRLLMARKAQYSKK